MRRHRWDSATPRLRVIGAYKARSTNGGADQLRLELMRCEEARHRDAYHGDSDLAHEDLSGEEGAYETRTYPGRARSATAATVRDVYPPTDSRNSDGVWLVCFLNATLNVDFDAKPASSASASILSRCASPVRMRRCTSRTR